MKNSKVHINSHIIILGYMASGKSLIGKNLANKLSLNFIDLDDVIESTEKMTISEIFKLKGELEFRKLENKILINSLNCKNYSVISLGGGTPCYFDNMNLINDNSKNVFFINTSNDILSRRLYKEKNNRPMISQLKSLKMIKEYVSKHVFERIHFYRMANYTINAQEKKEDEITNSIIEILSQ